MKEARCSLWSRLPAIPLTLDPSYLLLQSVQSVTTVFTFPESFSSFFFFFFFFFFLRRHQFSWPYTAVGAKLPQKGAYKQSSANSVLWRLHWFWWLVLEHEHEPVWVHEGQSWQLLELCHQCKLRVPGSYFRHHF